MLTILLVGIAILIRAALWPNSAHTHLLTSTMTRKNLVRKAVSNDARQNSSRTPAPESRNTEDDKKLKTLLPTFCKYHHTHGGCSATLQNNAQYRRLLQEGLKRMPESVYLRAEVEEIYPKSFDDYCAGKAIEARQKKLMVEFFNAWTVGIHAFMQDEASMRAVNGGQ